jgi:hypothetical protein
MPGCSKVFPGCSGGTPVVRTQPRQGDADWKTRDRSASDRARVGLRRIAVEQPPDTRFDLGSDASFEHMPMNIRRLGGGDLNARDAQTYSHVMNGRRVASPVR